jgi:formylglycine-generating enzyme required for sulfatase activity
MTCRETVRNLCWLAVAGVLAGGGCNRPSSQPAPVEPVRAGPQSPPPAAAAAAGPKRIVTAGGIEMALIPGGQFTLGDDQGEEDEKPAHRVRLSPFYIDTSEVSQAAFQKIMGRNPSKWAGPDKPVERMSWHAAIQFCNMRSLKEGLHTCYDPKSMQCNFSADGYRLPTEAEWEYACRAGTTTRWSFGDDAAALASHGWFKANADKRTHPVRQKQPNPWGLFDMHGNVAEWCNDFYRERYDSGEQEDPHGPASGEERVLRGGSFNSTDENCRCAARGSAPPGLADTCFGYEAYGFRCVRRATGTGKVVSNR